MTFNQTSRKAPKTKNGKMAASGEAPQVAAAASPLPAPAVAHADDGSLHEVPLDAAPPIDVRDADARAQAAPAGEAAAEAQPQGANERGVWATLKWFGRGVWWTGEFIGEVVADFIGITDSKYQYVIDAYERHLYQVGLARRASPNCVVLFSLNLH
jgi:hypothetical protein